MRFLHLLILLSLAGLLAGCPIIDPDDDDDPIDDDDDQGPIEVAGSWTDGWDFHVIDDDLWTIGTPPDQSDHHISQYSNDEGWAVAQNATDHPYSPDLWSRFDWTSHDGAWWICQSAFDADDEATALATAAPDATDPATGGCNTFPWSQLVADQGPLETIGQWVDGWGYEHEVRQDSWVFDPLGDPSITWLTDYDNDAGWAVGQNDPVDSASPDLWSRFDFTWVEGDLYLCQMAFDAADEAAALAAPASDPADLETGCAGYPWSDLVPFP